MTFKNVASLGVVIYLIIKTLHIYTTTEVDKKNIINKYDTM